MTNDTKLDIAKTAFVEKLMGINTRDEFKTLLANITRENVKNFIMAKLQAAKQSQADSASAATNMATEINTLITEVDNI